MTLTQISEGLLCSSTCIVSGLFGTMLYDEDMLEGIIQVEPSINWQENPIFPTIDHRQENKVAHRIHHLVQTPRCLM